MSGAKRFNQLQESLGHVSPKTLSQRLKVLEAAHILTRPPYAEIPPRVEYALTDRGHALLKIIEDMREFGDDYLAVDEETVLAHMW